MSAMGYRTVDRRGRHAAFGLAIAAATVAVIGMYLSDKWDERQEEIRRNESSAGVQAEMFWKTLIQGQWRRAQSFLSQRIASQLADYARNNGQEGVGGGLLLLRQRLPPALLAKGEIKCHLKTRKGREFAAPIFDKVPDVIGGTCGVYAAPSIDFFSMAMPKIERPFPVHFDLIREAGGWKVVSFSLRTVQGDIVLDGIKGMALPQPGPQARD